MSDEAPRLFLITPRLEEAAAFRPLLEAALEAADVACLLIRASSRDEGTLKAIVRELAPARPGAGRRLPRRGRAPASPRAPVPTAST